MLNGRKGIEAAMNKQTLLESSARRFMPRYFAKISDGQIHNIKRYIKVFTAHTYGSTPTGAVLDDAAASEGKMIRPRLLMTAAEYGPKRADAEDKLCKLAAVVEMTHLASLIHDDVVDDAPFRRSKPSIQHKYGKNAAVYAGDFLMSRISYYLMKEGLNKAGMVLAKTVESMCGGEIGQARCRYRKDVTIDQYLHNIHGKTVALFMACCRIGAMESGCSENVAERLEAFGECLGYMFQIRDDLLDFTADRNVSGKNAHQDFREGIYTLPVLIALSQSGGEALYPYMERSAGGTLTDEDIADMEQIVMDLGGMEEAWNYIRRYQCRADMLLSSLPPCDASRFLRKLVQKLGAVQ